MRCQTLDVQVVSQLITTLGFPIVCVIFLSLFTKKLWETSDERNKEREEKLYTIIGEAQAQNKQLSDTNAQFVKVLEQNRQDIDEIKSDVKEIKGKVLGS